MNRNENQLKIVFLGSEILYFNLPGGLIIFRKLFWCKREKYIV